MAKSTAATASLPIVQTTHLGIVAGLAMGPAVALGLGRFAYALLLPAMRSELGWSYAQAGAMNTANAAGYLLGALAAAALAARFGDKLVFLAGLLLTALALMATGCTSDFVTIAVLRAGAGAAGASSLITGGALASAAGGGGGKGRPALALSVYFGGAGLGMVVSAFAIPALVETSGWQSGWLVLGALGAACAVVAIPAVLRAPSIAPHGVRRGYPALGLRAMRGMLPILLSYVLFGIGYVGYTTFIVAYLRNSLGFAPPEVTLFWGGVGAVATGAGLVWGSALSRLRGGRAVAAANAVVALGAMLPVLLPVRSSVYVSALLFGGSFLIVPTSVTAFARRAAPPERWTAAIAILTIGFAVGQCAGPLLSGAVSDGAFGVGGGLLLSGGVLACAALIALLQREPVRQGG